MTTTDAMKCTTILNEYGVKAQRDMLIEECAELIQAVNKLKRAENSENAEKEYEAIMNYIGELADVRIMIGQMFIALTPALKKEYTDMIEKKLDRQIERINEAKAAEKEEYSKWRSGVNA